ncbi:MAG: hypothetical protein K2N47_01460 [Clostridia bacterium]|nr:hypothetical protein [Clostridia bacterium]
MKKFLAAIFAVATLALCLTLSGCFTKYRSHYSSSTMITTNTPDSATVSFDSFKGTYVIKFNNNGSDEMYISYDATLGEGNIKVYYDFNDEKLDLFEINTNGSVEGQTQSFTGGKIIYIVIESDGKCNDGSFSFDLKKS